MLLNVRKLVRPMSLYKEPRRSADRAVGDAGWQVMNEVTLHRGRNPHLTVVDAYFDGQHLTEAVVSPLILPRATL